jgi:hypothetical protein
MEFQLGATERNGFPKAIHPQRPGFAATLWQRKRPGRGFGHRWKELGLRRDDGST